MSTNRHGTATSGDVLVNELNDGVSLEDIWLEITDALTEYNKQKSALAGLLSYRTINVADAVPAAQSQLPRVPDPVVGNAAQ